VSTKSDSPVPTPDASAAGVLVLKTPPLLLGAALLVWGWRLDAWAVAIPLVLLLEAAHWLHWRWSIGDKEINRIVDLCGVGLALLAVYATLTQAPAEALFWLIAWLPLVLFPLIALQRYSDQERLPLTALSMQQRRRGRGRRTIDVSYPYFIICAIAASLLEGPATLLFYGVLLVLWAWALWPQRSRRYPVAVWLVLALTAGGGGLIMYQGVTRAQEAVAMWAPEWLLDWFDWEIDPYRRMTALGSIGRLKLSSRIVLRVAADSPPKLLQTASYNTFADNSWYARASAFRALERLSALNWAVKPYLGTGGERATIVQYLQRGDGMLSLPLGTYRLLDLPAARVEGNRLGAVKAFDAPAIVRYGVLFNPAAAAAPPTEYDVHIPAPYRTVLAEIAAALAFDARAPAAVPAVLERYFAMNFRYSLELDAVERDLAPLVDFLRHTRSGHCEYFASAAVLLLRQAGIPARYASGYSVQEYSPLERRYIVRKRHAHAWALAYIDGRWQNVDVTPPIWSNVDAANDTFLTDIYDVLAWLWLRLQEWRMDSSPTDGDTLLLWLLPPLGLVLLWRLQRQQRVARRRRVTAVPSQRVGPGADSECYRILDWHLAQGLERAPGEPLATWLRRSTPRADARLEQILHLHYRYRFDPKGLDDAERSRLRELVGEWLQAAK